VKNGNETAQDCGNVGTTAAGCLPTYTCGTSATCDSANDCASGVCTSGTCRAATCTDDVQNGNETAEDCGNVGTTVAGCLPTYACGNTLACDSNNDCQSGKCTSSACAAPSCTDGVENPNETDVDCGGVCVAEGKLCAIGKGCGVGGDCVSGNCTGSVCVATCTDGIKNGTETGIDCGGSCPACASNPCAGVSGCSSPIIIPSLGSGTGDIGLGAACYELTTTGSGGFGLSNFSGRSVTVNGSVFSGDGNKTFPAKVNGGYCFSVTAGDFAWAAIYTFI
jgi:hypothetical protein